MFVIFIDSKKKTTKTAAPPLQPPKINVSIVEQLALCPLLECETSICPCKKCNHTQLFLTSVSVPLVLISGL